MQVIVIGGSISGLSAALEILKLNPDIELDLYEKKKGIGQNIVCGGAISSFMLREIGLKIPRKYVAATIRTVRIYSPNGGFWELKSSGEAYAYVLWRGLFERHLAHQIMQRGGYIHRKTNLIDFRCSPHIFVAADGLTGISRKLLGLRKPSSKDIHLAVQWTAHLPSHSPTCLDLYFGSRFAPKGYAWVFPEQNKMFRVGLGIPLSEINNKTKIRRLLSDFTHFIGADPVTHITAKLIPTARPEQKLVYGKVLLIGDAGLLCDPLTGGGIATGVQSGKYAAKAIHDGKLSKYERYCARIKRRNNHRYTFKQILCDLSDQDYNALVASVHDFNPNLIRISWAMMHALARLVLTNPSIARKHRILRRFLKPK